MSYSAFDANGWASCNLATVVDDSSFDECLDDFSAVLVENALKYASSGKLIEISGTRAGDHVELAVKDHGPGISADHIPRLTERFYRVSVKESRSRGGTGLGLAIVKHILNRHRGRLVVTSEPGRGSVFTIRLPVQKK